MGIPSQGPVNSDNFIPLLTLEGLDELEDNNNSSFWSTHDADETAHVFQPAAPRSVEDPERLVFYGQAGRDIEVEPSEDEDN